MRDVRLVLINLGLVLHLLPHPLPLLNLHPRAPLHNPKPHPIHQHSLHRHAPIQTTHPMRGGAAPQNNRRKHSPMHQPLLLPLQQNSQLRRQRLLRRPKQVLLSAEPTKTVQTETRSTQQVDLVRKDEVRRVGREDERRGGGRRERGEGEEEGGRGVEEEGGGGGEGREGEGGQGDDVGDGLGGDDGGGAEGVAEGGGRDASEGGGRDAAEGGGREEGSAAGDEGGGDAAGDGGQGVAAGDGGDGGSAGDGREGAGDAAGDGGDGAAGSWCGPRGKEGGQVGGSVGVVDGRVVQGVVDPRVIGVRVVDARAIGAVGVAAGAGTRAGRVGRREDLGLRWLESGGGGGEGLDTVLDSGSRDGRVRRDGNLLRVGRVDDLVLVRGAIVDKEAVDHVALVDGAGVARVDNVGHHHEDRVLGGVSLQVLDVWWDMGAYHSRKLSREAVETNVVLDGLKVCRARHVRLDLVEEILLGQLDELVGSILTDEVGDVLWNVGGRGCG